MPGAPPQSSRGVIVNRLVCGGLWLVSEFHNETTGFDGHGIFGYDVQKKKYVGTWIDPCLHGAAGRAGERGDDRDVQEAWLGSEQRE
jgi:hypothetical protein